VLYVKAAVILGVDRRNRGLIEREGGKREKGKREGGGKERERKGVG
jgi:hypothetical protein